MISGDDSSRRAWPDAFDALMAELSTGRGRPAFVSSSDTGVDRLIPRLELVVDRVVSVGSRLCDAGPDITADGLLTGMIGGSTLLTDIEVLFSPALGVEVVSQLRRTAQNTALIILWPGRIAGRRLSYSLPGRADHVDEPARDLVVLRPVDAEFPDEVPYTVERYPA